MNNIRSNMNSSQIAKASFYSLKVNPDTKYSFAGFIARLQQVNKALSAGYTRIEETEIELLKTYSKQVAGEKTLEMKKEYAVQVKTSKDKLYAYLNEIISGKRSAIEKYVTETPPEDLVKYIQAIQFRINAGGKIGDNEWNMIVRRVSDSGNYIAMNMLNDLAITINRDFALPFDIDSFISQLDDAETILKSQIDKIDTPEKDWNYSQMVFLSDKPNEVKDRYIAFDSILGVSVPEKEKSIIDHLKESAQVALHNGKDDLFHEIYGFISENRNQLMSAEEAKQEVMDRAEALIAECLEAGKEA